jgi:hypothetical protein
VEKYNKMTYPPGKHGRRKNKVEDKTRQAKKEQHHDQTEQ